MIVVIPAHNEATVLPACLRSLCCQVSCPPMRIIVVANGCTDDTASCARHWVPALVSAGHQMEVFEIAQSSKPAALNLGDEMAGAGVRLYLDADVQLSETAIREISRLLSRGSGVHFSAPRLSVAEPVSWVTRMYASVWTSLPYIRKQVIGCGCYAVSEEGRHRWDRFPDIISDDKFVRLQFDKCETRQADAYFTIQLPEGLLELAKVRGRWSRGNKQVKKMFPQLEMRDSGGRYRTVPCFLFTHPGIWLHVPVFLLVHVLGKLLALLKRGVGTSEWERAERARRTISAVTADDQRRTVPATYAQRQVPTTSEAIQADRVDAS